MDSNRRPAGLAHLDYALIVAALEEDRLPGLRLGRGLPPYPDPDAGTAERTMQTFRHTFVVTEADVPIRCSGISATNLG